MSIDWGGPRTLVSVISFNTRGEPMFKKCTCEGRGQRWELAKRRWGSNAARPVIRMKPGGRIVLSLSEKTSVKENESICPGLLEWEVTSYHTGYFVITLFFFFKKLWILFFHPWGWLCTWPDMFFPLVLSGHFLRQRLGAEWILVVCLSSIPSL